ncbi:Peptidase S53 domain-containing protein [Mycena sanguinolenta]|uniref:Peptidase S53 domain-containing protein n=1 Tax=Mycena sanguinolenta TaxID=230812 RepID=A0A8H7DKN2_9AGAR|nr:Peptidase S53 domain-containing protein [Mycena sanguinolenta]
MALLHILPLVLLSQYVYATALVVHESISDAPSGVEVLGSPSPTQEIELIVAMVQSNITGLAKVVDAVSFPSSPSYGQYLTAAQVAEYVKPAPESVSAVADYFGSTIASLNSFSPAGDIIKLSLTVEQAEGLFNTTFRTYSSANGQQMIRALNYSLPSTLQQHVLYVHPIISFTTPPQRSARNTVYKRNMALNRRQNLAPCEDIVHPACIQEFYGLPNKTISGSTTNTIGVAGYNEAGVGGEYVNNNDLAFFLNEFRPDIAGNSYGLVLLNGAENLQDNTGGLEGQIDIQYTVGIAGNVPTTYVLDENDSGDAAIGYMDTINWLLTQETPPTVFTTSYANEEAQFTLSTATSLCNGYMQLAAIGVSMIFGSGDGGAANDHLTGPTCTEFVPMFPASCPYVTSVGGTFFQPPTAFVSSGGGFSNYFPVPSWQAADTSAYLSTIGDEYSGMYNPSGRGIPDVASEWEVYIANASSITSVGGTSCASPIFASFIALVNDRLIAAGKPVLGFLNPLLYTTGTGGLDDVTTGQSSGCEGPTTGWLAGTGWDPVSGLGTPNFPGMMEALGISG